MYTSLRMSQKPFARASGRGRRIVGLAAVGLALTPSLHSSARGRTAGEQRPIRDFARDRRRHRQRDLGRRQEARGQLQHRHGQRGTDPAVESQEHGGSAEDFTGHVAGIDRRSDRRQHRDRRLSGRRRRAVFHDAADGLAAVRHADAVVLRDHDHLPARRHRQSRWKSCKADRRSYLPAARWAPRPISFSRRARTTPSGSLGLTYGDENLWRARRILPASRSAEAGTAASAVSGAPPTACAIRSSRRTKAAS